MKEKNIAEKRLLAFFKVRKGVLRWDIVFDKTKIKINHIRNFLEFYNGIINLNINGKKLFYRGYSDLNYLLIPSIFREKSWLENEDRMFHGLLDVTENRRVDKFFIVIF